MTYALLRTFILTGQIPRNGISGSKVKVLTMSGNPVTVSEELRFWFFVWGRGSAEGCLRSLVAIEPWQVHKPRDVGIFPGGHTSQRGVLLILVGTH